MSFFAISEDLPASDAYHDADDVALMLISGELDYGATPRLRERAYAHIDRGRRHIVVDLSDVTFIDSTAIGALVGVLARLRETGGGSLRVVCAEANARVLRIFDIAGVATVLELHSSRDDALRALERARSIQAHSGVKQAPTSASGDAPPAHASTRRYAEEAIAADAGQQRHTPPTDRGRGVDELA
jgi:anti-sigma B factor antagonist